MSKVKLSDPFFVCLNGIACIPVIIFSVMLAFDFLYPVTCTYHLNENLIEILIDLLFRRSDINSMFILPCIVIALVNSKLAAWANRNTMSTIAFVLFFVNIGMAFLWPA